MYVQAIAPVIINGEIADIGQIVEISPVFAHALVASGRAVIVDGPPPEVADAPVEQAVISPPETAEAKPARAKRK